MQNETNNKALIIFVIIGLMLIPSLTIAASVPDFAGYKVDEILHAKPSPVNLASHPRAKKFQTMLKKGAEKGPNFSGHYTIVTWGCGVACQELAIVDARDGSVFFPPELKLNAYHMVTDGSGPFNFRIDSRLLIITGSPNDSDETGIFYYVWSQKKLKRIHAIPKGWKP